ncbi:MAG: hypothetical protein HS115_00860 [Spirochaetales bacterium]|nr:hypothetical protein [Spirochaetales bacterium]
MARTSSSKDLALIPSADLPVVAASLVHEVKNPLAAIHLHLQLLQSYTARVDDPVLRETLQNKIDFIKNEISGLNTTLQEFIRKIKPGSPAGEHKSAINQIVRETLELLEIQAHSRDIDLQLHLNLADAVVAEDAVMLKQVLINLILNAIEALSEDGRQVQRKGLIAVETGSVQKVPFVRVHDNGPGIAPDLQEKIFDPFFTTRKEGSGLGLAIVKKMVTLAGGQIEVDCGPEGTDFTVYLGRVGKSIP